MRTIFFCALAAAGCASTSTPVERPPAQQASIRTPRIRTPAETKPSTPSSQTVEPNTNINEGPSAPTEVPLTTPNQLP
jgi:hypothetical protein